MQEPSLSMSPTDQNEKGVIWANAVGDLLIYEMDLLQSKKLIKTTYECIQLGY